MKKTLSILTVLAVLITSIALSQSAKAVGYTLAQVQTHNTSADCWTAINNKVYNLTSFIAQHPGGQSAIIGLCGINGTTAFNNMHSGNTTAINQLANLYIGDLVVADTTNPSIPGNLTAAPVSNIQINLTWTASTDNVGVSGYQIFRDGVQVATTTANYFNNTGLTASTTYAYHVRAFDAAGNKSDASNTISTTTLNINDNTNPSTPSNLNAAVISANQINLSWNASTDNTAVAGYEIFRNGSQIATTTANSFQNIGLTATTTYNYMVRAFDAAGNRSDYSNTVSATTLGSGSTNDTIAPSAPSNLRATVVSYRHVNLTWATSTDNVKVKGYKIYRNGMLIGVTKHNRFNSIGLTASTTYAYTVKAYDKAGNLSAASNTVTVTTLSNKGREKKQEREDNDHQEKRENTISKKIEKVKEKISDKIENIKIKKEKKESERKKD